MANEKVIAVDLGGTKVKVGIVEGDNIRNVISENIDATASQKKVLEQIEKIIDKVYEADIKAICIGVPSIVDLDKGVVLEVVNIPSWKKVPLKRVFEDKYKIKVIINNDAKCFALGEKYFGKGKKYNNVVGLIIGTGIGAGIIINGKLYSGTNCGAGEFGEVVYKDKNFEVYCSGKLYKWKYKISNGREISKKARDGDQKSLEIFKEQGENIGMLIALVVNSVDPEIIILGGSVTNDFDLLKPHLMKSLKKYTYKTTFERLKIENSENKDIALLGAASLYFDSLK